MTSRSGRAALAGLAAAWLCAACDNANPPSPVPVTPAPTAVSLQPVVFLLRPAQLPDYRRSAEDTLSPGNVASAAGQPSLRPTLEAQGFLVGARATYNPLPAKQNLTPFTDVVSTAVLFRDASGAHAYFGDEARRRNQAPEAGGSTGQLTGLPGAGVDELAGLESQSAPGGTPDRGFLVLLRRGRVVAELFCGGVPTAATREQLLPLLADQVALLQQAPELGG